jgi:drug/metabolite transporter (DMT)-like permease
MPAWVLYLLVVSIWGSSWYGIELQLGVVAPQVSLAYRFLLAAAILLVFCAATRRKLRFPSSAHRLMAAQGLFLFCVNYLLFYYSGHYLVSGLMAVCFSTMSVMNVANMALFFRQRPDNRVVLAALVGLAGLGLVFYPEFARPSLGADPFLGLMLAILATYSASLGNMISVRLKRLAIPVVESNTIGMSYGALFCILAAVATGAPFIFDWRPAYGLSLVGLALFATVIGFGSYLTLVQRIGADRAAYATIVFPVLALGLSTLFEAYEWSALAGFGFVLILSGNLLILTGRRPVAAIEPAIAPAALDGQ